jgi:hypothetical protein
MMSSCKKSPGQLSATRASIVREAPCRGARRGPEDVTGFDNDGFGRSYAESEVKRG